MWVNNDGLVVRFDTERAQEANAAEYTTDGPRRFIEIILDPSRTPAVADGDVVLSEEVRLPAGAWVEEVEIVPTGEFTGTSTLDVGIVDVDRSSNADGDYFIEAATVAELNAGGSNDSGWVGDAVGAALPRTVLFTWNVGTAVIAGGKATIRVYFQHPEDDTDTLIQS